MKFRIIKSIALYSLLLNFSHGYAQDIQPISALKTYSQVKDFKLLGENLSADALKSTSDNAKIVIYRTNRDASQPAPISFFLNGDYQTSLMPGGYTMQDICIGINNVSVAVNNADHFQPLTIANFNAQKKQVYFFESILSGTGQVLLFPRQIDDLKEVGLLQMHTISRYTNKPCKLPPSEKIILNGDGFFAFDKSGIDDLQDAGRVKLATLVKYMRTDFERIDSIKIDGYTDRFGSTGYNEKLSLARANTVRTYFQQHGINAQIVTRGWGPANPIVECQGDKGKAVTDCLYPNRRIEVSINGLKKPQSQ